jgi:hypothetical protein
VSRGRTVLYRGCQSTVANENHGSGRKDVAQYERATEYKFFDDCYISLHLYCRASSILRFTRIHTRPPLVNLNEMKSPYHPCFIKTYFNIILPSTSRNFELSLPSMFISLNITCTPHPSPCATCSTNLILHLINIIKYVVKYKLRSSFRNLSILLSRPP